jgi:hypothetical protein
MKIIVTDNSDLRVIIYTIPNKRIDLLVNDETDLSEVVEDLLSDYHKLSEISWMQLEDDFTIENIEL